MTENEVPKRVSKLLVLVSYPATIALGFALYAVLIGAGWSVTLASYISVLTGAALITLHEIKLPYRKEWKPKVGEIGADSVYMITVQVAQGRGGV